MTRKTEVIYKLRKYNLLIVDDHALFREGLMNLFAQWQKCGEITEVADVLGVLNDIGDGSFDAVILDIQMTSLDGLQALKDIKVVNPNQVVLVLTSLENDECVRETMKLGVNAFLVKHETFDVLTKVIETTVDGGEYFSPPISKILLKLLMNKEHRQHSIASTNLNVKEVETLMHICNQLNTDEIAEKMYISNSMVKKHRMSLMSKTESKNTAGLFLFAVKNKFVQIEDLNGRR
jgi:DNA-binding NarL/FixJ family response regulator